MSLNNHLIGFACSVSFSVYQCGVSVRTACVRVRLLDFFWSWLLRLILEWGSAADKLK
jgi:hypothetical protein